MTTLEESKLRLTKEVDMIAPISVRLDAPTRKILEDEAKIMGVGLGRLLRQIAEARARDLKRKRIREASAAVGRRVASNPDAAAFYEDWGTPRAEG